MSKEEILEYFKDINHAYNDCTKHDTLKRMLDELQDPYENMTNGEVIQTIFPNVTIEHKKGTYDAGVIMYNIKWWNAPYGGVE